MDLPLSVVLLLVIIQYTQATYYYRRPVTTLYRLRHHHHHHHHRHHQPMTWYNQPMRVYYNRPYGRRLFTYTRPYPATGMNIPSILADRNTHHPTNTNTVWPSETIDPSITGNDLWKDLGIDKNTVVTDKNGGKDESTSGFPVIPSVEGTLPDLGVNSGTIDTDDSVDSKNVTPDSLPVVPDTGFPSMDTDTTITVVPEIPDQDIINVVPGNPDQGTVVPGNPDQGIVVPGNPDMGVTDINTNLPGFPDQDPNTIIPDQGIVDTFTGFPDQGTGNAVIPDKPIKNDTQALSCHITGCRSGHECVFADNWICPIYIPEIPCECRLGCRLDYNFIPFGKEITIDECGNVCKCMNIYGAAECTQRMCNINKNNDTNDNVSTPQMINKSTQNNKVISPVDVPIVTESNQGGTNSPGVFFPELPNFPNAMENINGREPPLRVNSWTQNMDTPIQGDAEPVVISRNIIVPSNNLLAERLKSEGLTF